jgi:hypothetical protein
MTEGNIRILGGDVLMQTNSFPGFFADYAVAQAHIFSTLTWSAASLRRRVDSAILEDVERPERTVRGSHP